jgi:hypothetical protein
MPMPMNTKYQIQNNTKENEAVPKIEEKKECPYTFEKRSFHVVPSP